MVFKGSANRTAEQVNRDLDDLSASSNAFTSEEQTVYYATTLPEEQENIVELLADIMRPVLRQDDFDTEKQVILEEIAKYDDQPPYGAHEKCMAAFFGDHPLGKSILGTTDSVGGLKRDQMLGYFEQRYSPKNMVLSAAGNVDFDALVLQAQNYVAVGDFRIPRCSPPGRGPPSGDSQTAGSQQYVVQLSPGPAATDDDRRRPAAFDDVGDTLAADCSGSWRYGSAKSACPAANSRHRRVHDVAELLPDLAAGNWRFSPKSLTSRNRRVTEDEACAGQNKVCAHSAASRAANEPYVFRRQRLIQRRQTHGS
jgi:hypothetical protein